MDFLKYEPRSTFNALKQISISMINENSYDQINIFIK